jgi:uncharacterized membrane protein
MTTSHRITIVLIVIALLPALPSCSPRRTHDGLEQIEVSQGTEKLRVLYIESEPRWDYRALTAVMLSDSTIAFQSYLVDAAEGFTQKSSADLPPLTDVPRTIGELTRYDVIVLGDLRPTSLDYAELLASLLGDFLEGHGGGLVAIAGRNYPALPSSVVQHLPVRIGDGADMPMVSEGFAIRLTDAGYASAFMNAGSERDQRTTVWAERMFYSYLSAVVARPSSQVLGVYQEDHLSDDGVPVVVIADVGKGRSLFWGVDELWRIHSTNAPAYKQIWKQALRHVSAGRRK